MSLTQRQLKSMVHYDPAKKEWRWINTNELAGSYDNTGDQFIILNGKSYLASQLSFFYTHGVWSKRLASNNTSGSTGVHWSQQARKWQARLSTKDGQVHLGFFNNKANAIIARNQAKLNNL